MQKFEETLDDPQVTRSTTPIQGQLERATSLCRECRPSSTMASKAPIIPVVVFGPDWTAQAKAAGAFAEVEGLV